MSSFQKGSFSLLGKLLAPFVQAIFVPEPKAVLFYGADLRWQGIGQTEKGTDGHSSFSLAVSYCGNPQDLYLENPREQIRFTVVLTREGSHLPADWKSAEVNRQVTGKRTYHLRLNDWEPSRDQILLLNIRYGTRQFPLKLQAFSCKEPTQKRSLSQHGSSAVSMLSKE